MIGRQEIGETIPGTILYVYIGTAGEPAVSVASGCEAARHSWQYWTFMSIGLIL